MTLDVPLYKLGITVTEQRKHQRFDLRLPFEIVAGEVKNKAKGETRNVSSCGVLFTSKAPVEVGSAIEYLKARNLKLLAVGSGKQRQSSI